VEDGHHSEDKHETKSQPAERVLEEKLNALVPMSEVFFPTEGVHRRKRKRERKRERKKEVGRSSENSARSALSAVKKHCAHE
jgi:hypothetical protein